MPEKPPILDKPEERKQSEEEKEQKEKARRHEVCCRNCIYVCGGYCRKHAPAPIAIPQNSVGTSQANWPRVDEEKDWCGEILTAIGEHLKSLIGWKKP